MSLTFDLTREPWIPVERLDGTLVDLSTRVLLRDAHQLRGLADGSPLVLAALTRHLLAALHRAYAGPRTMNEWVAIARARCFDPARIDGYLDTVADRMDLFHPTHPFAQTRGLREQFADFVVPIDEIEVARSRWGGGRSVFRHRPEDPPATMSPARAARALLAHHAFATGGLVKKPGEPVAATAAPLVRAGVVILRGSSLYETLLSNLLVYDPTESHPIPLGGTADACSWEQAPPPARLPFSAEPKEPYLGYLDLLTRMSRRVELVFDGTVVTHFINAVWKGLPENAPLDPMVAFRRDDERGMVSIGINPDRSFWRDSNALFEATRGENSRYQRPRTIDLVVNPKALDILGKTAIYTVEVLGLAAEKSRVDAVRIERVTTTARCFDDADARTAVEASLAFAKDSVDALRSALWSFARHALSPGNRDPDRKDIDNLVKSLGAERVAWSALGVEFDGFLRALVDDPERAAEGFRQRARRVVRDAFKQATDRSDSNGRWFKAQALAQKSLDEKLPRAIDVVATVPVAEELQS